jgi:hypothetical protein
MSTTNLTPASSEVVVSAPMSFAGSAQRIWKITKRQDVSTPVLIVLSISAILAIALAWTAVLGWYLFFGILLIPYRLIRRGQRKTVRDNMRHQEMLSTMAAQHAVAAQALAQQLPPQPIAIEAVDTPQLPPSPAA